MDAEYLQARIDATKAQIEALESTILALSSGAVRSSTLDTGQTKQTVTREDLGALRASLDGLYNRLVTLEARLDGSGQAHVGLRW